MKYRTLAGTGISVSNLSLGTMGFGSETAESEQARQITAEWSVGQITMIEANQDLFVSPYREDGTTYGTPTQTWALVVDGKRARRVQAPVP